MTRPTRIEINCETLEETVVELTDAEIAEMEAAAEAFALQEAEREAALAAQEAAKASGIAKLLSLGLTEEEANALTK